MILHERIITMSSPQLSDYGTILVYSFQTLALLEIVHVLLKLVRANILTTAVQVLGRLQVLLFFWDKQSWGNYPLIFAWAGVEIVRYLYLALHVVGISRYPLLWLRYSLFYILYPVGVFGEMKVLYDYSLTIAKNVNVQLYIRFLLIVVYVPALAFQYTHMIKQRRTVMEKFGKTL